VVKGIEKERMKGEDGGRGTLADLDVQAHGRATAHRLTRPGISHFRCAASGFSGNSDSSNSPTPTFSDPPNPSPVTPCLVFGCGLLSVSERCRFDRVGRVREGSVSP
jgi:hypothetical protein